uniref:Uncharacterized protein n=1 Tax=Rhizophora mucronata TaxID=61149 RepID=A0A2P2JIJ3_RHIMU
MEIILKSAPEGIHKRRFYAITGRIYCTKSSNSIAQNLHNNFNINSRRH